MLNASNLLRLAILKHHDIIDVQRRIVMAIGIRRGDGQPHLFREYADRFLIVFGNR